MFLRFTGENIGWGYGSVFLWEQRRVERFGSAEGLVFRRGVSQVAFLVVENGLGTVLPEEGRLLTVCFMCSEEQMLPGRGVLTSL